MEIVTVETGFVWTAGGGGSTTVVDNLTTASATSALSANQGVVLKGLIDDIEQGGDAATLDGQEGSYYLDRANHTGDIPAENVTEDATHRFATDAEKTTWNDKQDALGFTPENIANKGQANGYASLDSSGKIDSSTLPTLAINKITTQPNLAGRLTSGANPGDAIKQLDNGITYLLSQAPATTDANWVSISDITPDWSAVENKPTTFAPIIGSAGNQAVAGNDSRLSNARTPTAHTHPISEVDGLQTELDEKADSADLATVATSGSYADLSGQPTIRNVQVFEQELEPSGGTYFPGDLWIQPEV